MRMIAAFSKLEPVRFVSHLDMQRLFQRAFRRAGLPLAYSQGFNPHPLLSFATALSVGYTSSCEYLDVMLTELVEPSVFMRSVNAVLPDGVRIENAVDAGDFKSSLTTLMRSAEYDVRMTLGASFDRSALCSAIDELLSGEIIVDKKTKGGIKSVDIRPLLFTIGVDDAFDGGAMLSVAGSLTAEGGLPLELLFGALYDKLGVRGTHRVHRKKIEMERVLFNE